MTLKEMGRKKKSKGEFVICRECGDRVYLNDENTEQVANIKIAFCSCGNEIEVK